jgi:hypothetical protein
MGAVWSTEALPVCASDREKTSWVRYRIQEEEDSHADVLDVLDTSHDRRVFAVLLQSSQARSASALVPRRVHAIGMPSFAQVVRDLEPAAHEFRAAGATTPPPRVMLHTLVSRGGARSEVVTPTRCVLCEVINKSSAHEELLWSESPPPQ